MWTIIALPGSFIGAKGVNHALVTELPWFYPTYRECKLMNLMSTELYDALTDAGADESKARSAAPAVATSENRFSSMESRMALVEEKIKLLQWMVGINMALTTAVLWKVIS